MGYKVGEVGWVNSNISNRVIAITILQSNLQNHGQTCCYFIFTVPWLFPELVIIITIATVRICYSFLAIENIPISKYGISIYWKFSATSTYKVISSVYKP